MAIHPRCRELTHRIHDRGTDIEEIGAWLDGLDARERWAAVAGLGWRAQRELYARAGRSEPLTVEHFVPSERGRLVPVVHDGRNSLPVPGPLRSFQKVFARPADDTDGDGVLYGFNEGASRPLIGPGYFVMVPTDREPGWRHRGALVVDYFRVPQGAVPASWPQVQPNHVGLQRFVFDGTRDFMRRVSQHVSVGAAFKGELAIEQFFVLCRRE